MSFELTIPQSAAKPLAITINVGDCLFMLGANGTGKSSLMHRFYGVHRDNAQRITAHRQTWFASNTVSLSPEQKRSAESNIRGQDTSLDARWKEAYPEQRTRIAIYDLVEAENMRAREITAAVDGHNIDLATTLSEKDAPIKVINNILRLANIPIEIFIQDDQVVASKYGGVPYSIVELSDGERNALLIASKVLTTKPGTLILIDEPERHLHRSIISPLLTHLFAKRLDCAFIISTHEMMLPLDNPSARVLLIRACTYTNSHIVTWDVDLVPLEQIDDNHKRDILGARRRVLFIEGTERSLDNSLYALVFPNISIVAKSSCRDVEQVVSSIRESNNLHWLHAFGIVDNDRRKQEDIDRLKAKGVYAISVFSVESIYYHPDVQRRVAERHAAITGEEADALLESAKAAAIAVISSHVERLSQRTAEKAIREEFFRHVPQRADIIAATPINVVIDVAPVVAAERRRLQQALDTGDLSAIIAQYPVRETAALVEIVRRLGFQNHEQYEGAVRKLLMDDQEALTFVRSLFGTLEADLNTA